jgi:hypothetical protein
MNPRSLPSLRPCSKAFNFADRESPCVTLSDRDKTPEQDDLRGACPAGQH